MTGLVGRGLFAGRLQPLRQIHHLLDTGQARSGGERRGGLEQSLLHRIGEIGPADTVQRVRRLIGNRAGRRRRRRRPTPEDDPIVRRVGARTR